ncbi:MAG: hypothetical protein IIW40_00580, partial [Clostridia bacterium]|nr:hypothetical protein [Clostridia bacterium]
YITIIKRMWHLLPYEQLMQLLDIDMQTLAITMREDDFLDIKVGHKPICEPVVWRELTAEEQAATARIREIVEALPASESQPFDFRYAVEDLHFKGKPLFNLRMLYGFSGLYQKAFDVDSRTYLPDDMLEAYQKAGINALWTQGVLYQLSEFPFEPNLSAGYQDRICRLRELTERCEKYGIKIFLYINEPRAMQDHFFERHPTIKGFPAKEGKISMCTSTKEVQDYLTNSISYICTEVPKLGGFFTITRSENPTNCYSHSTPETCTCPRCRKRSVGEVVGEVIACIEKGAHRVNPNMQVIAWSWGWDEFNMEIIRHLPDNVVLMSQSELDVPFNIGGVEGKVIDYSMGQIGPGERAKAEWKLAKERGLELAAKVQVSTTWECSTVPALPVYPLVEEHIRKIREEGVTNLLLGWTLGGYPSRNIMYAAKYFYEHCDDTVLALSPARRQAAEIFSEAFKEFPFDIISLYFGPHNSGPATMLFLHPTGYEATMTCFAYDDIESWRGIYPREVYEQQFAKLCARWEDGLALLTEEKGDRPDEMYIMAHAAYCLFRASLNQFRFYVAREKNDKTAMRQAATDELACAKKMLGLVNRDASIGFEASNHYYFSRGCLVEKVINCHDILRRLEEE